MRKLFILMFVVVAVLGFVGSPTTAKRAEAASICDTIPEPHYSPATATHTYTVDGQPGQLAASIKVDIWWCRQPDGQPKYIIITPTVSIHHRNWTGYDLTMEHNACVQGNISICEAYRIDVKFYREDTAAGVPRLPVCVWYWVEVDGQSGAGFYYPPGGVKTEC